MSIRIDKDKLLSIITDYLSKTIIPAPSPAPSGAPITFDYFIELKRDFVNNTYIVTITDLSQGKVDQYTLPEFTDASRTVDSFIASVSGKRIYIRGNTFDFFSISLKTDNFYVIEGLFEVSIDSECDALIYNTSNVYINSSARMIRIANSLFVTVENVQEIYSLSVDAYALYLDSSYIDDANIRVAFLYVRDSTIDEGYIYSYNAYIDGLYAGRDIDMFCDIIEYVPPATVKGGTIHITGKIYGTVTVPAGSSSQVQLLGGNFYYRDVNIIYSVREAGLVGKVSVSYDDVNKIVTFINNDTTNQATVDYIIVIP